MTQLFDALSRPLQGMQLKASALAPASCLLSAAASVPSSMGAATKVLILTLFAIALRSDGHNGMSASHAPRQVALSLCVCLSSAHGAVRCVFGAQAGPSPLEVRLQATGWLNVNFLQIRIQPR